MKFNNSLGMCYLNDIKHTAPTVMRLVDKILQIR